MVGKEGGKREREESSGKEINGGKTQHPSPKRKRRQFSWQPSHEVDGNALLHLIQFDSLFSIGRRGLELKAVVLA